MSPLVLYSLSACLARIKLPTGPEAHTKGVLTQFLRDPEIENSRGRDPPPKGEA